MPFTGGKKCLEKPLVSLKSLIFRGFFRKTNTGGIALKGGGGLGQFTNLGRAW